MALPPASAKQCTLLLLSCGSNLLLGLKKRGFGQGKLNGFGGKLDPQEPLLAGALREMQEESGVSLPASAVRHAGHLLFTFEGKPEELHVHVFAASAPSAEALSVAESEEMAPLWVPAAAVPYEKMWLDDKFWLPLLLAGKSFRGAFHFRGHEEILSHSLQELQPGQRICEYVEDCATAVLITAGKQGAVDF